MKRPTFLEGVGVAIAASVAGGVLFTVLASIFAGGAVMKLMIAAIGLAYVIYLLRRSRERVGRVAVLTLWLVAAAALWLLSPALPLYLAMHVGMIWLIRSLYFYSSVLSSLADLGVNGLSIAAAIWAGLHTGSVFLSIWCFFLVQALFVAIPAGMDKLGPKTEAGHYADDHFEQAHRAAEAALRKFSSSY